MGERIDEFKSTAKEAGNIFIDSTLGVTQGVMVAAWPIILLSAVALLTVALIKLPRQAIGGGQ